MNPTSDDLNDDLDADFATDDNYVGVDEVSQRSRGRTPPPAVEPSFDIKLDGQVVGTVYPRRLKGAAQIDLEEARTTRQVIEWVVKYAGGNAHEVESVLRELELSEVSNFVKNVATALEKSVQLSKRSGPRSRR